MKSKFILFSIVIAIQASVFGQSGALKGRQISATQKFINVIETRDKAKIAAFIYYPLKREYPLKDVKDKNDFVQRFDEIFDKGFIDHIAQSKIKDWSEVGSRGIMLDNGVIWIDDAGKIVAINYQSAMEQQLLIDAIQADKNQLSKSLRNFLKPLYLIFTKDYKIRIDEKAEGIYRYAGWKIRNKKSDPEIIIENGVLEFQGSGGNHTITFKNSDYTYIISVNEIGAVGDPDATLEVLKQGKTILNEAGQIKRN